MLGDHYTPVTLLQEARGLIAAGFCKGSSARDAKGIQTPFGGPKAVQFCTSGALCHLANCITEAWKGAVRALKQGLGIHGSLAYWNDAPERTQQEVLDAYDDAIDIAQAELDRRAALV